MTPTGYYTGDLDLETVAGKLPPQTIDYKKVFLEVDWTKLFVFTDPSATILKCINSVKIVNRVNDQENLLEEKRTQSEQVKLKRPPHNHYYKGCEKYYNRSKPAAEESSLNQLMKVEHL